MLVVSFTLLAIWTRPNIEFGLIRGHDYRVVELCVGARVAVNRLVVIILVVIRISGHIKRLAQVDLERLKIRVNHLGALCYHTLNVDIPGISWGVA